jgi:hypothetical protein
MAEPTEYTFTHKEVVTALIRQQDIHSGRWSLSVQFGLAAMNIGTSPANTDLNPAAVLPILSIGLRATSEITNLTVDAAEVNPKP